MYIFSDLKAEEKEAIENFQSRLTKAEHMTYNNHDLGVVNQKEEPNTQYEVLRRRITTNIQELWNYISSELGKLKNRANEVAPDLIDPINQILQLGLEHKRYISTEKKKLV